MVTRAPSAEIASAQARPRPRLPPKMSAGRPSSPRSINLLRNMFRRALIAPGDANKHALRGTALAEPRCASIIGQHIGVAIALERRIIRIRYEPGTRWHDGNTRADAVVDLDPCKAGAAIIEDADYLAAAETGARCIAGIEADRRRRIMRTRLIELPVKLALWLRGQEMELVILRSSEPFLRLDPGGHWRAVMVTKTGNGFGIELDLAAWRAEPVFFGIGAEITEQHLLRLGRRDPHMAGRPESVEIRDLHTLLRGLCLGGGPEMA